MRSVMVYKRGLKGKPAPTDRAISMGDSAGDDSIRETEDQAPVSITGNDDAGTDGGDVLRKDTEKERIKEQEVTYLTCETENEDLVPTTTGDDDDEGHYIDDFPRKDKGKGREIIKEQEANTSEPAQYLMNCAICTDTIQDSQMYIMVYENPICFSCLQGCQNTFTLSPDPVVMIPTDENARSSAVPPQLSSTIGSLTLRPETGRSNPHGRKRGCLSLSRRRDRWRVRSMVARERARQSRQRRQRYSIERTRRISRQIPSNFSPELVERMGGVPQSRGVFEQDLVGRIGTRAMEPRNNRQQRKMFYESEQGYRDLTMKHHCRIRKWRATVVVPRQIQTAESRPPPAVSLPPPSHSSRVVEGVPNPRTELKSTATLRPVYMGPPPSEAGPSNLSRVARPNPQLLQVHYIRPFSITSNNLFFAPPEAFPAQAWRNDDEEMQE